MAYALFSPTTCTHSGFKSMGTISRMYNQDTTDSGCAMEVGGSNTGTINLTGLKQVNGFNGLTPTTMPNGAVVNNIVVRIVGYTTALKHPTCSISAKSGNTTLATASKSSWGSITDNTHLDASATIDISNGYGIDWVQNLTLQFTEKGNYSLNTSTSIMSVQEIYLFVYWEIPTHTINFKNQDGSSVKSMQLEHGKTLGTLPVVSRDGYTFMGWLPCAPAKKTDGSVLDS